MRKRSGPLYGRTARMYGALPGDRSRGVKTEDQTSMGNKGWTSAVGHLARKTHS